MAKLIIFLLIALVIEAVGVVFLSHGLKQIGEAATITPREILRLVVRGMSNRNVLIGTALETTFFVMLLVLLKENDVSLIWPLTSLGFVLTALAARFIRHEEVSGLRWSGVLLIVAGAALVAWSERLKGPAAAPIETRSTNSKQ
jgi:drug/metabolite transporter (DMT)-like permease